MSDNLNPEYDRFGSRNQMKFTDILNASKT